MIDGNKIGMSLVGRGADGGVNEGNPAQIGQWTKPLRGIGRSELVFVGD